MKIWCNGTNCKQLEDFKFCCVYQDLSQVSSLKWANACNTDCLQIFIIWILLLLLFNHLFKSISSMKMGFKNLQKVAVAVSIILHMGPYITKVLVFLQYGALGGIQNPVIFGIVF